MREKENDLFYEEKKVSEFSDFMLKTKVHFS